ncbi:Sec62/63 complex, subunit Sec66 [Gongronella butleri]|nr:Sec62/63 complex, subunit Sec66 [Gongronella butleri]
MEPWFPPNASKAHYEALVMARAMQEEECERREEAEAKAKAKAKSKGKDKDNELTSDDSDTSSQSDVIEDYHARAALLLRAEECVRRLHELQANEKVVPQLLLKGLANDRLLRAFQEAISDTMEEAKDIMPAAELLQEGWSKTIFTHATHMLYFNELKRDIHRDNIAVIPINEYGVLPDDDDE